MILQTKVDILNWLKKYDDEFEKNIQNHGYEFIDIHDLMNSSLLKELIKKDHLPLDYFENLKLEGHRYIINVKMGVDISKNGLEIIPIQFYHVKGFFFCDSNQLTSLKGCPQYVGASFDCHQNKLNSLQYSPQIVGWNFYCHHNQLTSLEYCPEIVTKGVYLKNNEKLLKYKNKFNDSRIQNMSDDEFLLQEKFSFWKSFHLMEKSKKENKQILDDLILDDKIEQLKFRKI